MLISIYDGPPTRAGNNAILSSLSLEQRSRICEKATLQQLPVHTVLFEADVELDAVYFIEQGFTSLTVPLNGASAFEACTVGSEGMVGLPLFLNSDRSGLRAYQDVPAVAYRLPKQDFLAELDRGPELRAALSLFTNSTLVAAAQRSVCNGRHSVEQRCIRWLLTADDHFSGEPFRITHFALAQMLGVRRATVSVVAGQLQEAGYIRYHRGLVAVSNRIGLEALCCECYARIRQEFERHTMVAA